MDFIESLEPRRLLAVSPLPMASDPGNTIATALNLGTVNGVRKIEGSISPKDRADCIRLNLHSEGNFNVVLSRLKSDVQLDVLDSTGKVIATATRPRKGTERLGLSLGRGIYYLRIGQRDPHATTRYHLQLQADLNWGTAVLDGQRRQVGLVFADGSARPINPNQETWIVIHGWGSSPRGDTTARLAAAIDGHSRKDQVLMLDWSEAAAESSLLDAAAWVPAVAQQAAKTLGRWGIPATRINIAGHSLGGYLSAELASALPDGVNRLVALDPATLFPGTFPDGVDFSENSRHSIAFIASSYSTPASAATADEAFRMNVGPYDSIFSHVNVVELYAGMLEANNRGDADPISRLFSLNRLSPSAKRPWKSDAYTGGFEGTITGQSSGGRQWDPKSLVYIGRVSGKQVTVKA